MLRFLHNLIGPRIPRDQWKTRRGRYLLPSGLLVLAAALLVVSVFMPYWKMTLKAPQYPNGLHVQAYLNRLTGDVQEIDGLNHYIGMRPLEEAAQLERSLSMMMMAVLVLVLIGAIFIHNRWAALFVLPAVLFPVGFLVDLYLWMSHFGQNLDPKAPLSSSIKPFVPPVLGEGKVGQFVTIASADTGLILATIASVILLLALWFHRAAYKPLVQQERKESDNAHRESRPNEA